MSCCFCNRDVPPSTLTRGAIGCGLAGTGKTLVARALAATASKAGTKVSFFMRKGADVLSKWVGEAERQLRLLFEEAQKAQPSIIFFDEIDGLAPVSVLLRAERPSTHLQKHRAGCKHDMHQTRPTSYLRECCCVQMCSSNQDLVCDSIVSPLSRICTPLSRTCTNCGTLQN